jgi:hypothetical protein
MLTQSIVETFAQCFVCQQYYTLTRMASVFLLMLGAPSRFCWDRVRLPVSLPVRPRLSPGPPPSSRPRVALGCCGGLEPGRGRVFRTPPNPVSTVYAALTYLCHTELAKQVSALLPLNTSNLGHQAQSPNAGQFVTVQEVAWCRPAPPFNMFHSRRLPHDSR